MRKAFVCLLIIGALSTPLFPQCSLDSFIDGAIKCVKAMGRGYPYKEKNQCMSRMDGLIGCMTSHVKGCMDSNCPSIITSIEGVDQVLPIVTNVLKNINSLDDIYYVLDGNIKDLVGMLNIPLPNGTLAGGVKNIKVPLSELGIPDITVHEIITQVVCPEPGKMPAFLQKIMSMVLPEMMRNLQQVNTTRDVPFCDGDFASFIAKKGLKYFQDRFGAANRKEYCGVQKKFGKALSTVMYKKCDLSFLPGLFQQMEVQTIPPAYHGLLKSAYRKMMKAPAMFLDMSGCLLAVDVKLKFKRDWDEALKNQTSEAYKGAAKMATEALKKMMGSADNDTLAVVWEFSKGSIVANTSMPLMEDNSARLM